MRLNNRLKCKICENDTTFFQAGEVLGKYLSVYVVCKGCGFLTVENTFFVSEAYDGNVCIDDAGVLGRNIQLADVVEKIVVDNFDKKGKFLDYAGGCGILVRLMRDKGFDFYLYDPITTNIFARGFEFLFSDRVDLITCFEGFEHFIEPLKELEKMLSVSESILFSTELLPDDVVNYPSLKDWWYYDLKNGQHISFYSS